MERRKEIKTEDKITHYLQEQEQEVDVGTEGASYLEDDALLGKMHKFLETLDSSKLSDQQAEELSIILDDLTDDKSEKEK